MRLMAENLVPSFLRLHAKGLGWTGVYKRPTELDSEDTRGEYEVSFEEEDLKKSLIAVMVCLLQMPASADEWMGLYAGVLRDVGKENRTDAEILRARIDKKEIEAQSDPQPADHA